MRTGQVVKAAFVAKAAVNFLQISPTNPNLLVTGSADKILKSFDLRKGEGKNLSRVKQMKARESILCGEIVS